MDRARLMQAQDLALAGRRVHVWTGGTGPGLLLIHAAWGDARLSWGRVWEALAGSHRVIAPDLPGFGPSSALPAPSLDRMADMVSELLDVLHQDRTAVVGNSFGAGVALRFAHAHPARTSCLVLVNGGYMPVIPGPLRQMISLPLVNRAFRSLVRSLTFSPAALQRSFVDPSSLPPGFRESIQEHAHAYSRIAFDTIMNMSVPLGRPAARTTLLWGAQDGLATLKQAHALQRSLTGAELVLIEGAGHMPQVERPAEFVEVLSRIVER